MTTVAGTNGGENGAGRIVTSGSGSARFSFRGSVVTSNSGGSGLSLVRGDFFTIEVLSSSLLIFPAAPPGLIETSMRVSPELVPGHCPTRGPGTGATSVAMLTCGSGMAATPARGPSGVFVAKSELVALRIRAGRRDELLERGGRAGATWITGPPAVAP